MAAYQAAYEAAGLDKRTLLPGHGMGGGIARANGRKFGDRLSGVIVGEAQIQPPEQVDQTESKTRPIGPKRVFPTGADAPKRFRVMPEQPCDNTFIVDFIAEHSLRQADGG